MWWFNLFPSLARISIVERVDMSDTKFTPKQKAITAKFSLLLLVLVLVIPAFADTVSGTGGVSSPVPGFSDTSFQWIDNTGGVSSSVLSSVYGYNIFQQAGLTGTGSLLLSNPFTLGATSTLDVSFSLFTAENHGLSFNELGFAILLQNSQMVAVLGATRPDGANHVGDFGNFPGVTYLGPSAGVTTTYNVHPNGSDVPVMTLGSQQYGTLIDLASCGQFCMTDVNSSYTPGAGTYQILYGSFVFFDPNPHAAGVAVKSVKVPEPMPIELVIVALMFVGALKLAPRLRQAR
jgi:hypothetical protein